MWFEFARTNTKYYKFEAGKTYKVEFEYKILKAYPQGKIFCFFRDDSVANRFETVVGDQLRSVFPETRGRSDKVFAGIYAGRLRRLSVHDIHELRLEVAIDNILITEVV